MSRPIIFVALIIVAVCAVACSGTRTTRTDAADKPKVSDIKYEQDGSKGRIQVDEAGANKVTVQDAKGVSSTFETSATINLAEFGLKAYPGAEQVVGPGGTARITTPQGTQCTVPFTSQDKPDDIVTFYKQSLKVQSEVFSGETAFVSGTSTNGAQVTVTAGTNPKKGNTEFTVVVVMRKK